MKKKSFAILLIAGMLISAAAPALADYTVAASPTASAVLVNGESVAFEAYNIKDNNYFKLRDLAYTLSNTAKPFDVAWDGADNVISLTSGKPYTPVGGELQSGGEGAKQALPTTSSLFLDGQETRVTAYNIAGNTYFKLRDIGALFDFEVDWDGAGNTVVIDTGKGYTLDTAGAAVNVLLDSRYFVYGDQLLKTELFSYQDEIYAPLQGIFEANYNTFIWDDAAQSATVTHNSEITPDLEAIAERWGYPWRGRGNYRTDYVRLTEFDPETGRLSCAGSEDYSFQLAEQEQEQFQELLTQGVNTGGFYHLVAYYPWPLAAGPLPPEEYAPIFVEISEPYSVERQALIRPITVSVEDNGAPVLLSMDALEYSGILYISINALNNALHWFWYGSIGAE